MSTRRLAVKMFFGVLYRWRCKEDSIIVCYLCIVFEGLAHANIFSYMNYFQK